MATYTAANATYAAVNTAYGLCSAGDTLVIPAGTETWASQLVVTIGIYIVGAGVGNTVITSGYAGGSGLDDSNYLFVYAPAAPGDNVPFELSGIECDLDSQCDWIKLKNIDATNIVTKIRIHHNKAYGMPNYALHVRGNVYGVFDNNDTTGGYFRFYGMDANWTNLGFYFGSANNFYIEDNTIDCANYGMVVYGEVGSRYCFRYNTVTNSLGKDINPAFDSHGNQLTSGTASMGIEVYNNTITIGNHILKLTDHRGGKAIIFGNDISNSGTTVTRIREEYDDALNPPEENVVTGQPQYPSDSYFWNNIANGSTEINPTVDSVLEYGGLDRPTVESEFWYKNASFDGTTGIGVGLKAARPATCTTGVAYWATDENKLYKATSTNVWTEYYVPYIYPHPLRGAGNTQYMILY